MSTAAYESLAPLRRDIQVLRSYEPAVAHARSVRRFLVLQRQRLNTRSLFLQTELPEVVRQIILSVAAEESAVRRHVEQHSRRRHRRRATAATAAGRNRAPLGGHNSEGGSSFPSSPFAVSRNMTHNNTTACGNSPYQLQQQLLQSQPSSAKGHSFTRRWSAWLTKQPEGRSSSTAEDLAIPTAHQQYGNRVLPLGAASGGISARHTTVYEDSAGGGGLVPGELSSSSAADTLIVSPPLSAPPRRQQQIEEGRSSTTTIVERHGKSAAVAVGSATRLLTGSPLRVTTTSSPPLCTTSASFSSSSSSLPSVESPPAAPSPVRKNWIHCRKKSYALARGGYGVEDYEHDNKESPSSSSAHRPGHWTSSTRRTADGATPPDGGTSRTTCHDSALDDALRAIWTDVETDVEVVVDIGVDTDTDSEGGRPGARCSVLEAFDGQPHPFWGTETEQSSWVSVPNPAKLDPECKVLNMLCALANNNTPWPYGSSTLVRHYKPFLKYGLAPSVLSSVWAPDLKGAAAAESLLVTGFKTESSTSGSCECRKIERLQDRSGASGTDVTTSATTACGTARRNSGSDDTSPPPESAAPCYSHWIDSMTPCCSQEWRLQAESSRLSHDEAPWDAYEPCPVDPTWRNVYTRKLYVLQRPPKQTLEARLQQLRQRRHGGEEEATEHAEKHLEREDSGEEGEGRGKQPTVEEEYLKRLEQRGKLKVRHGRRTATNNKEVLREGRDWLQFHQDKEYIPSSRWSSVLKPKPVPAPKSLLTATMDGGRRATPASWPALVPTIMRGPAIYEDMQAKYLHYLWQTRNEPRRRRLTSGLRIWVGGYMVPHDQKRYRRGDDSWFCSESLQCFGVCDGVGELGDAQWRVAGFDCRGFGEDILREAKSRLQTIRASSQPLPCTRPRLVLPAGKSRANKEWVTEEFLVDPCAGYPSLLCLDALVAGFYGKQSTYGAATCLLGCLDKEGSRVGFANIGDSRAMVLRRDPLSTGPLSCVGATESEQHGWNMPVQLARFPDVRKTKNMHKDTRLQQLARQLDNWRATGLDNNDRPETAALYDFQIQEGDLIVLGTDGLWDNLFDADIMALCGVAVSPVESEILTGSPFYSTAPRDLAKGLCLAAYWRSMQSDADTPFARSVRQAEGTAYQLGGKTDDISVVCAWAVAPDLENGPGLLARCREEGLFFRTAATDNRLMRSRRRRHTPSRIPAASATTCAGRKMEDLLPPPDSGSSGTSGVDDNGLTASPASGPAGR